MEGQRGGRTDGPTDVRTDVHDVMAIKLDFLTWMGYHIFLAMVLCTRVHARGAPLLMIFLRIYFKYFCIYFI